MCEFADVRILTIQSFISKRRFQSMGKVTLVAFLRALILTAQSSLSKRMFQSIGKGSPEAFANSHIRTFAH